MSVKGKGKAYAWILANLDRQEDECLIWPFCRNPNGYGQLGYLGKMRWAHRFVCELVNGPPPTPKHEGAHSCGNGSLGCVHPKHLSWKTTSENLVDCQQHGTHVRSRAGRFGKLNMALAGEIRLLKGVALQKDVALQFNISESTVSDIWRGKAWSREHKGGKQWTPEDDAKLREAIAMGYNFSQAAKFVGRSVGGTTGRTYRLGLKSGYELNRPRTPVST